MREREGEGEEERGKGGRGESEGGRGDEDQEEVGGGEGLRGGGGGVSEGWGGLVGSGAGGMLVRWGVIGAYGRMRAEEEERGVHVRGRCGGELRVRVRLRGVAGREGKVCQRGYMPGQGLSHSAGAAAGRAARTSSGSKTPRKDA